ncbi:sugar ABC transporter substrate-binding protein [Actinotalea sp. M2MS4P-6]|uniref:sugar ABC transporter substrate-binding protein n=1 Tax=Actinotalea sp. M2MS4P-6 TaxID=2983762 RepID=UPI0021E3D161|nr:sugar ABC transporter substrate-binding protein [Actinotalea sp. M2MS4P-6]MCV2394487.1 sugar ABC transporter substrate-binding protein [Actinotalea sp. M2MS4P-6]
MRRLSLPGRATLVLAALSLALAGCSAATATDTGSDSGGGSSMNLDAPAPTPPDGVAAFEPIEPGSGEGLKIGFTQLTLAAAFPQALQSGMEEAAATAGVDLVTCDSKFDTATALDCARQFKTQDVDGLVIFQADAAASESICDEGPDVPAAAIDINQEPCQKTFVGAANEYAGQLIGYNVAKYFGENFQCDYDAYISLESTAVGVVNDMRMDGTEEGFESVCGPIHDEIILDTGAGGQTDVAQRLFTDTLTSLPGADKIVVVGINEDVILGALAAARAQDRTEDLYIGVQNLDPDNCAILTFDHWIGSAAYFPEKYAQLVLPAVIDLINGEDVPDQILVPHEFITKDTLTDYYPEYSCS